MLKKSFIFLVLICSFLPLTQISLIVHAIADQIVVTEPSVYVRKGANIHDPIIKEIKAGSVYDVLEEEGDWIKIKLSDEQFGWVANWVVTGYQKANLSPDSGIVTADGLRVRNGPGNDFKVLGNLPNGEVIQIKEVQNDWILLNYNGVHGWVNRHYVHQIQPVDSEMVQITASTLHVRTSDKPSSAISGTVKKGEKFQVLEEKNHLLKIKLSSKKEGWIPSWYTDSKKIENSHIDKRSALKRKTILLDAGHGGTDGGATGPAGTLEKNLTLHTVLLAYEKLKTTGANVILTRSNDRYLALSARANLSNIHSADAFISFHYDSNDDGDQSGIKTYYNHPYHRELAVSIQQSLFENELPMNNQGVKQESFRVLQENLQPAILVELGYINNPAEEMYIQTPNYQETITDGIVNGLADYFSNQ